MEPDLKRIVAAAAGRADVRGAVDDLYARVQAAVDERRPKCLLSGRCCRFEEYGHRLYVTTLELAHFLHSLQMSQRVIPSGWDGAGCPFQKDKLCTAHAMRPFGCRMFFCDPASTDWQRDAYERFHAELKQLHDSLGVPYAYVEWRQALAMLAIT